MRRLWGGRVMTNGKLCWRHGIGRLAAAAGLLLLAPTVASAQTDGQSVPNPPDTGDENRLSIQTDSALPDTYLHANYQVRLSAVGGVPALYWEPTKDKGMLPPGIKLEHDGLLHGAAEQPGEYQFTVSVRDTGQPQQAVEKRFLIRVRAAFTLNWKSPAHVTGRRIEGSVEVSNATPDDIDLTFIVLAVASNGRATAIGYQHFPLQPGTLAKELPFGDTLPRGGYVVHVDAVGEVAAKKLIYRERMQTSGPLQVTIEP